MPINLIFARARNGVIGKDNQLPWHLPEDLAHFKRTTLGQPVIMGRKTWDSLPASVRPLPGRRNVVITRDPNTPCPGAERYTSLEAALQALAQEPRVFVIGGAQIYALALPWADELLLTEIDAVLPADAHFPAWRAEEFELVDKTPSNAQGADAPVPYAFATYRRRP